MNKIKLIIKELLLIILISNAFILSSQNYEVVYYQINATNKVISKKIISGDTIFILQKKAGSKYVDSLKINKLNKQQDYYSFKLPDSLPNGKYGVYYNDKKQNLAFIVNYNNYKRNGPCKYFHYNGTIKSIGFYKDNCLDKVYIEYDNKGRLMHVRYFVNCKVDGTVFNFSQTGDFFDMTNYKNGIKEGPFIRYSYDKNMFPKIMYDLEYKNGDLIKK